jgi:spore maturation protein CgeB
LGSRFHLYGRFLPKHNLYFNVRYRAGHWVRSVSLDERRRLHQRAKIGVNIHYNDFGLGNQRLYHLPANGVLQITDCADHLHNVFQPGMEALTYRNADELIDLIRYYLSADSEREAIARAGYRRTMADYKFTAVTRRVGRLIVEGMARIAHSAERRVVPTPRNTSSA